MPPLSLANGTLLLITPYSGEATPVLTPYAARGLTQTLELVGSAGQGQTPWLRRDVNGNLQDVSDLRFRKYRSVVSCRDGETPCIDDAWIGVLVTVDCAVELSYPTGASPTRIVVGGSSRVQGSITYYRPQLNMRITAIKNAFQEYAGINMWQFELEEV